MDNDNFVIEWLKDYFDKSTLDEKSLKPVLHFSLLWNLFEHTYFTDDKHLNPKRLLDLSDISFHSLEDKHLDTAFKFFKDRYFPEGRTDERFLTLKLNQTAQNGDTSNHEFCKNTLTASSPEKQNKVKCIFLIIYRFRNNLFHGVKNPNTLNIFERPFKEINKFLIYYIEKTANNNSINKDRKIT